MKQGFSFLFILLGFTVFAQGQKTDWFNKNLEADHIYGISVDEFYNNNSELEIAPVIVAVLDDGVDVYHRDFEGKLWINEDEIPDNGKDDDKNGFIDDVYGWNFLGNANRENIGAETLELTRLYRKYRTKFDGTAPDSIKEEDKSDYALYELYKSKYEEAYDNLKNDFDEYQQLSVLYNGAVAYMSSAINQFNDMDAFLEGYEPSNTEEAQIMEFLQLAEDEGLVDFIEEGKTYFEDGFKYHYNLDFDPRRIVDDSKPGYGNQMVWAENPEHGTHVAGIIGAVRGNDFGIDGVASNARIMALRVVPNGDERDNDVANAIRYAVDNGARVINMSFGKSYSPEEQLVLDAISYAQENDVLMIHAAGNDGLDIGKNANFPNGTGGGKHSLENWITVGASDVNPDSAFLASFSNFSKDKVDLIAPGVEILSLVPGDKTKSFSGTSMAAPVVAGMATVLRGLFPDLSAAEIKLLIIESLSNEGKRKVKAGDKSSRLKKVVGNPGVPSLNRAASQGRVKISL